MSEQPTLYRLVPSEITRTDARTLTGRAVPYDTPTPVMDQLPDGRIDAYTEGFRSTAFEHMFSSPQRIRLVDTHQIDGTHGPDLAIATGLRNEDGGLVVDFRVFPDQAGKVETLLDAGVAGLSVGFSPLRGYTDLAPDGTRWRTKAMLRHVSLEPAGAYPGAEVLAFRGEPDDVEEQAERDYEAELADLEERLAKARTDQQAWRERLGIAE